MKIGDLVRCINDKSLYFGLGIILKIDSRMAFIHWLDDSETEWLWKCNLETHSEKK